MCARLARCRLQEQTTIFELEPGRIRTTAAAVTAGPVCRQSANVLFMCKEDRGRWLDHGTPCLPHVPRAASWTCVRCLRAKMPLRFPGSQTQKSESRATRGINSDQPCALCECGSGWRGAARRPETCAPACAAEGADAGTPPALSARGETELAGVHHCAPKGHVPLDFLACAAALARCRL